MIMRSSFTGLETVLIGEFRDQSVSSLLLFFLALI